MTLNLKMILELDSRAAKAELEAAVRGIKGVTVATSELTGKNRASVAATDASTAAAKRAAIANRDLAASQRQGAFAVGNMAAQFNDIGVMLAAGQNPLQLAIQQGTQISQAFGNAGAAGAVNILKQGFLSIISPVNLITIGVIGFGAAAVQAIMAGIGASEDMASALEGVESALADTSEAADITANNFQGLIEKYGLLNAEIRALAVAQGEVGLRTLSDAATELNQQLSAMYNGNAWLNVSRAEDLGNGLDLGAKSARELASSMAALSQAATLDQQLAAASGLRQQFLDMVGPVGSMTAAQFAFYSIIVDTEAAMTAVKTRTDELEAGMDTAAGNAALLEQATQAVRDALAAAAGINLSGVFSGAFGAADTLLGKVGAIIRAAGEANAALANQQAAANAQLKQLAFGNSPGGQALSAFGGRTVGGTSDQRDLERRNAPRIIPRTGGGGGGGGAGAAQAEADALQTLIDKLNDEIAALQTQDPIQQEMLKYREALAGATDAERKQVEALIIAREREALAVEGMKASKEFFEQTAVNAIDALITKGESLQDVLKGVAAAFLKAAIQGALFGQGPFGAAFGGKSILSGLFGGGGGGGGFLAGLFGGKANGGMVYGRGTATSDSELRALSVGEYVVNAKATARNRHTLEAINAGGVPGLAAGGAVDNRNRRTSGSAAGSNRGGFTANFDLRGVQGDREIQAAARRGMKEALKEYDRTNLPTSMRRVSGDAKRIG